MAKKTGSSSSGRVVVGDIALAHHEGVSTKTVANWRNAGLRCRELPSGQYEYDLAEVAAFRSTLTSSLPVSETAKVSLLAKQADVQIKLAKAKQLQRQQRLAEGEVLDRETYELHLVEAVQKARDRFLRLPQSIAKLLPREGRDIVVDELRREVERTLNELHKDLERGPE